MEQVNRIIEELSGDSKDIAFRRALEETARHHLMSVLNHQDYDTITAWYTPDVTMVTGLDTTLDGEILKGHDEIINHFDNFQYENSILLVPILTISDRGRITVYTETFYQWLAKPEDEAKNARDEQPFVGWPCVSYHDVVKSREVVVFDLNEEMKVRRIEWRQLGVENLGKGSLDAYAKQSEELREMIEGDI
ncbi:hypothetical protein CSOJ01_10227 [Colletotrichum sojae]|uniref:SnoaL-like domain-containing protein n=1 Tax=Colletotrichum sojae TaxID=2175907 RepID=A0A8H6J1F5_9PEZI|nr:hypothetical protein CSOJ01_10227 [Colletotrichum sojae]